MGQKQKSSSLIKMLDLREVIDGKDDVVVWSSLFHPPLIGSSAPSDTDQLIIYCPTCVLSTTTALDAAGLSLRQESTAGGLGHP